MAISRWCPHSSPRARYDSGDRSCEKCDVATPRISDVGGCSSRASISPRFKRRRAKQTNAAIVHYRSRTHFSSGYGTPPENSLLALICDFGAFEKVLRAVSPLVCLIFSRRLWTNTAHFSLSHHHRRTHSCVQKYITIRVCLAHIFLCGWLCACMPHKWRRRALCCLRDGFVVFFFGSSVQCLND